MPRASIESAGPRRTRRSRSVSERLRQARESMRLEARLFARLFAYTRPYRGRLVASWVATLGYAAAGALIVSQVKPIFDEALIQGLNVGRLSLTILVLYVVKGASSYLATTLVADAGQRALSISRNALYEHILKQSFAFLRPAHHGLTDEPRDHRRREDPGRGVRARGRPAEGRPDDPRPAGGAAYMDWRLAILSLVGMPLLRLGQRLRSSTRRRCGAGRTSRRSCRRRSRASAW